MGYYTLVINVRSLAFSTTLTERYRRVSVGAAVAQEWGMQTMKANAEK
jgi:hypothetical protein